jgi:hypothetical protein
MRSGKFATPLVTSLGLPDGSAEDAAPPLKDISAASVVPEQVLAQGSTLGEGDFTDAKAER